MRGAAGTLRWVRVQRLSVVVVVAGLVATGLLSWLAYSINSRNESRLLNLQTKETGAVLQVVLPTIQTPLASAAALAASDGGDASNFTSYMSAYLGSAGPFVSTSLWRVSGGSAQLVVHAGVASDLIADPARAASVLPRAAGVRTLTVIGPVGKSPATLRLGYAFASSGASPTYVAYAESPLPPGRRVNVQPGSPFSDLRFALYLGRATDSSALLETNSATLPISGRTARVTVPFGGNSLTLVATPAGQLGGTLSEFLWWIVLIVGVIISVVAAVMTERLVRRRRAAESLTTEVEDLLREQRSIAVSLQHALLPRAIPELTGIEIAVRYIPGVSGVEIGGDWYDVIEVDRRRFFFVVGDVSGRGVNAGSVMASLMYAVRGFVSEGHPPTTILDTLRGLLSVAKDGHFATVLCGLVDVDRHEVTIANAGHLPPLLIRTGARSEFVATQVGPPIGVASRTGYEPVTVTVPPKATLLAYTDGLVERPGEALDTGLDRLRHSSVNAAASLEESLDTVVTDLTNDAHNDDTAILGMRWLT